MVYKNPPIRVIREDFFKPRIVYREIGLTMDACLLKEGWMINNKLYMISGSHLSHLIHYFNSKLFNSMVLSNANLTGGKGIDFMEKVLVPLPSQCDLSNCSINEIDDILNDYYNLSVTERKYINSLK